MYMSSVSLPTPPRQSKNKTHNMYKHSYRNSSTTNGGGYKGGGRARPPQTTTLVINPGQTSFRLLCHIFNVGGVIGPAGTVVKQLEQQTSSVIRIREPVRDCVERVVVVVGSESVNRTITVRGEEEGEEERWDVSAAQEGLVRVFERVLEVEEENEGESETVGDGGERCCRLLAHTSQIGAVMGRGGMKVVKIRNDTGAKIRVLKPESVPPCASPGEELIHITGGILAVKKALIIISRCLQESPPLDKAPMVVSKPIKTAPNGTFTDPHAEFFPHLSSFLQHLPGNSIDNAVGDYVKNIPNPDANDIPTEVVFRLLCSSYTAGGVIGKGGAIIRTLQNETGAFINFAAPVDGSDERLVTISAVENPETSHSPAQSAVVRVFARSIEIGIEKRIILSLDKGETVTARLLITSNQAGCLIGEEGSIISEMKEATGAEIQISGEHLPSCALESDEVVQIIGEYRSVQSALLHVTGRLRVKCFPSKVLEGAGARNYPFCAIPDVCPHRKLQDTNPPVSHQCSGSSPNQERIAWGMYYLGLSNKVGGSLPRSHLRQAAGRGHITATADSGVTTHIRGPELGSTSRSPMVPNTTIEVVVPENAFGSVYGENGGNLKCIRQISGAEVVTRDPSPGKSEGMVVISGTPDQIKIAQSLLQAFI